MEPAPNGPAPTSVPSAPIDIPPPHHHRRNLAAAAAAADTTTDSPGLPRHPTVSPRRYHHMDEFAQSREDDDLFADEFEPVSASAGESIGVVEQQTKPASLPAEPRSGASQAQQHQQAQQAQQSSGQQQQRNGRVQGGRGQDRRGRGRGGGAGRGGGGGRGGGSNGLSQPRYAPAPAEIPPPSQAAPPPPLSPTRPSTQLESTPPTTPTAPTATTTPDTRTHAVRGDRSATGGPAHKKLSEKELSEKMAKMAILNKERAEKHRLTEADQAAFQHREKELAKERKEKAIAEKKNERVMEMERAKNRERKMKAQGVREWDSEKVESDIVDRTRTRTSEYVRGGHGGVIRGGLSGSGYSVGGDDGSDLQAPRGRGRFEIRGRGGSGRGGRGGRGGKQQNPVPSSEDFPSLPTPTKVESTEPSKKAPVSGTTEAEGAPSSEGKSPEGDKLARDWAEEMATSIEESNPKS
ncbi:hypothetical protein MBM_08172 [Drepanopeziza brunnea f. sp. 'multigermtubi' MB_m1]|uniref:Uncharacterized protein n=1 Tax=Marssonina brunnea f. sp. multigermtubi (strain MB_m1) TaxID=1072389 RepID=K1WM50_MARBU|nr:uncharacterized protein MBM_08172 [Drepanopeziza brunnea f. sp. 'multigermtubi' MB_m1]EKD13971.1 hypothetical protein MBM_08172 [Drepanopeziza brunnea f. sp. 'multigermtubi' MB_m1]